MTVIGLIAMSFLGPQVTLVKHINDNRREIDMSSPVVQAFPGTDCRYIYPYWPFMVAAIQSGTHLLRLVCIVTKLLKRGSRSFNWK